MISYIRMTGIIEKLKPYKASLASLDLYILDGKSNGRHFSSLQFRLSGNMEVFYIFARMYSNEGRLLENDINY